MAAATSFTSPVNTWGVYTASGNAVFAVDTFLDLKYNHDSKVSDFPVELGAFTSYNKVLEPSKAKIRLAVGGQSGMAALIVVLETEVAAANLYSIYTPEAIYTSMTLEKFSYPRAQSKGANMLVVDLEFVQIRQVSPSYKKISSPKKKKSAAPATTGLVLTSTSGNENVGAKQAYSSQTTQQKLNGTQAYGNSSNSVRGI
jgi:hypothetical protein